MTTMGAAVPLLARTLVVLFAVDAPVVGWRDPVHRPGWPQRQATGRISRRAGRR